MTVLERLSFSVSALRGGAGEAWARRLKTDVRTQGNRRRKNIAGVPGTPRAPDFNVDVINAYAECAAESFSIQCRDTYRSALQYNIEIGGAGGRYFTGNIISVYRWYGLLNAAKEDEPHSEE